MREAIYFIALLPPPEIQKEIDIFRNYAAKAFESKHALNAPPHITIFPPFKFHEKYESKLINTVDKVADENPSFYTQLDNFDVFGKTNVIHIKVLESDSMKKLHRSVLSHMFSDYEKEYSSPHKFVPHISIAFKDLKKSFFLRAWSHFGSTKYERAFKIDMIALLKHEDQKWEVVSEHYLEE